ncbi:MAG: helix-turn-helix transcriptional regulator [Anaerolineales bacterium]|nr:helix-turn-helix transcriptional regulator [Chloroflexota bacterium]MBL6982817.1 helix-turn-helix transcriptional regulator [Anaerolineales bacterium]
MAVPIAIKIRAKKLGVLLRDARTSAGKTLKQCGDAIGVSSKRIASYEKGDSSPSLPELETLAFYLDASLDNFWGDSSVSLEKSSDRANLEKMVMLRRRIIGAKLRLARQEAGLTMKALAESVGISIGMLRSFERNERPIPLPELEFMLKELDITIEELRDQTGPVGQWVSQERAIEKFIELPPELQEFVGKPINQPYLELAQRLSEMSVDQLRSVAEGLLDITL